MEEQEKKALRKELLRIRNGIEKEALLSNSRVILEQLKELPEWKKAEIVYTYVSCGSEADTEALMEECFCSGKKVAVPKVLNKSAMEFYYISSRKELQAGFHGILEPEGRKEKQADLPLSGVKPLFIMPGLGFDREFHRLGYGGGFYDKYLEKYGADNFIKVAVAFSEQLIEKVPCEEHDITVDMIVSENQILKKRSKIASFSKLS